MLLHLFKNLGRVSNYKTDEDEEDKHYYASGTMSPMATFPPRNSDTDWYHCDDCQAQDQDEASLPMRHHQTLAQGISEHWSKTNPSAWLWHPS